MGLLVVGETLQRPGEVAAAECRGTFAGHESAGLGQVVPRHGLHACQVGADGRDVQRRLGAWVVSRPGARGHPLHLGAGRLGQGEDGDEALGQGVVDVVRPALALGGHPGCPLRGGELGLRAGQGRQRLLAFGQELADPVA